MKALLFAALLTGVSASFAQTTKTSTGNGAWATAGTWTPSGVPATGDNVVIAAGHTVTTTGITRNGAVTVNGTLSASGNFTAGSLAGSGTLTVTGTTKRTLAFGSLNTNTTFSGTITGNANFRKTGTGTLTWNGSGTNTYSGNTSIWGGGKITLGAANRIPDESYVDLCGTSTLDLNGFNETIAGLSSTGGTCGSGSGHVVTNSSSTLATLTIKIIDNSGGVAFSGSITGKLNLVVSGGGNYASQDLDGTNTYTGTTAVTGGILSINATSAIPSATDITITSPGQLMMGASATCNKLTLGTALQFPSTYGSTASSATTKNDTYFDVVATGVLTATSGQGRLKTSVKTGNWSDATVWSPSGVPNEVDNIKIAAGHTVTLTGNTTIVGNNTFAYNPGTAGDVLNVLGTLRTAGFNLTVNGGISAGTTRTAAGTINTGTGGVVTQNWTGTQQTAITITGSGGFTKLGSGATNFNRAQTYTGTTTIGSGAILGIGFNTTTGSLSSTSIVNDGTLRLNRSNDFTLSANISGTGDVVKMRSSTVTLSGNNSYQGKTYIGASISTVAGNLVIANTSSLPSATEVIFHSSTAGKLQLNADASCNKLLYGATAQASGTYGSTSSSASNQNNTYFSGTGALTVISSEPFGGNSSNTGFDQELPGSLDVQVFGNPSTSLFTLKIQSNNTDEKVSLKIADLTGRIVETKHNLSAGEMVEFGMDYKVGSYFVEAIQGEQRKVIRLVKQ